MNKRFFDCSSDDLVNRENQAVDPTTFGNSWAVVDSNSKVNVKLIRGLSSILSY